MPSQDQGKQAAQTGKQAPQTPRERAADLFTLLALVFGSLVFLALCRA